MNRRLLPKALLAMFACLGMLAVNAKQTEEVPSLIHQLSSTSRAIRHEAVRQLEPRYIGQLDPQLAVRAALLAAMDSDSKIRETALGGLGFLTSLMIHGTNAAPIAKAIEESDELRPTLEGIVREDPNVAVVIAASIPLMTVFGADPAAEELLLDRAEELRSPVDQVKVMGSLEIGGIDSEETLERLARYLDGAPPIVQHKAALLLLLGETLPPDRLVDFLRIMETPETFADPLLVRALPRFGVSSEAYLPRLLAMRSRLEDELQKPREKRVLAIYNDGYWKQTLEQAIAEARKNIQGKQTPASASRLRRAALSMPSATPSTQTSGS